jgi:GH35 family endo-1,4-beta-xylanase
MINKVLQAILAFLLACGTSLEGTRSAVAQPSTRVPPADASAATKAEADPLTPEAIRDRITKHRTAAAVLTVLGADGKPLANAPVVIRQTRHKFLFGSNGFGIDPASTAESSVAYRQRFAALFNYATLPFYWGSYEFRKGEPRETKLRPMAQWCQEKGITVKGHPLCWHEVTAPWLKGQTPEEMVALQLARIRREVSTFAGLIKVWDVVNEEVSMPTRAPGNPITSMCRKLGQVPLLQQTFAAARAADPHAVLALNDFDTSDKYEKLIRDALAAGVPIDVIGIQSHMHSGFWSTRRTWEVCERFGKLGRPLHFTEVTILSGPPRREFNYDKFNPNWTTTPEGEEQQAEQVEQFYTVLFSHPKVEGITWWDFSDRGAWLGAPAGLLSKDMVPKPAYEVLLKLIKGRWWTRELKVTTDGAGKVWFRGYLGSYAVESSDGRGAFSINQAGDARLTTQLVR